MATSDVQRYRDNLQGEVDGVALYQALANLEQDPKVKGVYQRLADTEARHGELWRGKLIAAGGTPPTRPTWRTRTLITLAKRFGPSFIIPTVAAREQADSDKYAGQADALAAGLPGDERGHAQLFSVIAQETGTGLAGTSIAQYEGRHRAGGGNALRAAVLGANDGLISNASLVMGVAGAELSGGSILVTGFAGLLAGALSMALGEWLSVQSARELYSHQIAIESAELASNPEEEAEELALIYQSKGLPEDQAKELGRRIVADQKVAVDTLAREELGVNPEELGGSAWEAAITSFLLFACGAIIPVIPFIFGSGTNALLLSLGLSLVALFAIGAGITLITGRSVWYSGFRQVLFGVAAFGITFVVGKLFGTQLGG